MQRLFFKIFILCWVINAAVFGAFIIIVTQTDLLPSGPPRGASEGPDRGFSPGPGPHRDLPGRPDRGPGPEPGPRRDFPGRPDRGFSPGPESRHDFPGGPETGFSADPGGGRRSPVQRVISAGEQAVSVLNEGGLEALKEHIENRKQMTGMSLYILDDLGADVLGRTLPAQAEAAAKRIREGEDPERPGARPGDWVGGSVRSPTGARFVVVEASPRPPSPFSLLFRTPGPLAIQLTGIVVTAGLIALVLAYYLTSPMRRLSAATRQFAAGDLGARAGPSVVKRRDAIGDLGREFDLMASRIQSLITAQQRLLRDVSHELRSPLARLSVALGIAARKAGADAEDALGRIEHEAEQLNELIGQLLSLSRLESSDLAMERSEFDLLTVVEEVAANADYEAQARACKVRINKRASCSVRGAEDLLRSALENLLRNAVSFTSEGTRIDVEVTRQVEPDGPRAVVSVRDRGPGVPEEHLSSIFEPFHRVEDARDRTRGGTGLGLAIAARAARVHGGRITASNAPDGGLIVELRIPSVLGGRDSVATHPE